MPSNSYAFVDIIIREICAWMNRSGLSRFQTQKASRFIAIPVSYKLEENDQLSAYMKAGRQWHDQVNHNEMP